MEDWGDDGTTIVAPPRPVATVVVFLFVIVPVVALPTRPRHFRRRCHRLLRRRIVGVFVIVFVVVSVCTSSPPLAVTAVVVEIVSCRRHRRGRHRLFFYHIP